MAGTLYLCATPIGNLDDMTAAGAETAGKRQTSLRQEDTRNTLKLLNHFEIKIPYDQLP